MRGSLTFQSLFTDETITLPGKVAGKGRCAELIEQRDVCLINRYFFYGKYSGIRYETVVQNLSREFFLTERRVQDIISENSNLLRELRKDPPAVIELKNRWPHLRW